MAKKDRDKEKEIDKEENNELDEEKEGGKGVLALVTVLIIIIWLGIIAILIKTDVGGFGSTVLYPILKDVPYINKILPNQESTQGTYETADTQYQYSSLDDAVNRIKELELQLDEAQNKKKKDKQTIKDLKKQIKDLSSYKKDQAAFEKEKEKFYEEVVFSDEAPDINEYKTYYESIDPENAEVLYKQVVQQLQDDQKVTDYANTYASMKPKEAAAIFDSMTDNFDLVAKILGAMDSDSRANILGAMNSDNAAKITKIMNPS